MIKFWNSTINSAAWCTIFIVLVIAINCLGIKWFGEIEFWLSLIKIITLTGLILLGLIIDLGGVPGQQRIGFAYWMGGKAFKGYKGVGPAYKFAGFVNALVLALFAYMGTELIGVTVGEAKNPRKTVPAAIRKTFFRILFFYIIGVLIVYVPSSSIPFLSRNVVPLYTRSPLTYSGMVVDSTSPLLAQANDRGTAGGASASPFVVAIQSAGIRFLPQLINACILLFTFSAANSDQYIATRTLYGMAKDGNAPRIFTKCSKRGVPIIAFAFTGCFMGLAYLSASADALKVFGYFTSAVTIFGGLTWISILASHIGFMRGMKAQGISRDTLPYKSPFQPYSTYIALVFTVILCFFKGFDSFMGAKFDYTNFITHYIGIPVYIFGYVGFKLIRNTSYVRLHEMDLTSGAREFHDVDDEEDSAKEYEYKQMSFGQKVVYNIKNW